MSKLATIRTQKAAERDLRLALANLLTAFPNVPRTDLQPYGAMLVQDVAQQQPSLCALKTACRHLRRTKTFLPTISEVLAVLAILAEYERVSIEIEKDNTP